MHIAAYAVTLADVYQVEEGGDNRQGAQRQRLERDDRCNIAAIRLLPRAPPRALCSHRQASVATVVWFGLHGRRRYSFAHVVSKSYYWAHGLQPTLMETSSDTRTILIVDDEESVRITLAQDSRAGWIHGS